MLVVGTFRDEDVRSDPERRAVLADVGRRGELVTLSGLGEPDVALLMAALGAVSDEAVVANVSRRTAGNPFFVREVTQLLLSRGDRGGVSRTGGGLPEGVRQVVQQRLARLPQPCVSLLSVVAVAGRPIGTDVLTHATGQENAAVVERLDQAVRAGVLALPPSAAGPYGFSHDLFRETVYEALPALERAELHRRVADALERRGGDTGGGHPAELARHFLLAMGGLPSQAAAEKAVRYSLLAAGDGVERLAYEDAVGHCSRALDGVSMVGMLGPENRVELLLGRADARRWAGETAGAREDYGQVTRLVRRGASAGPVARAALGVHALGVESGASRDEVVGLLEEALDRFGDEDSALQAQVLAALARELYLSQVDEWVRAGRLSSAAVQIARRIHNDATLANCLLAAHDTIWRPGTAARRRAIATEMGAVARRAGDRAFEAEACLLRASAGLELGDPAAIGELDEFVRLGAAVGQPHFTYLVLTRRAMRAIMAGRFAEADRLRIEAGALAEAVGEPDAWNVQTRLLWELRSAQGRRNEAEAAVRDVSLPHLQFWYDALAGLVMWERGDRAEAMRAIRPAVQVRPQDLPFPYVVAVQWAELSEAAVAAGLLDACQRFYDALRPHAGTTVVVAAAVGFGGAVDHHLGVLAAVLGRADQAVRHLEDAAGAHERLSAWPWLARTRAELAAALATRGRAADRGRVAQLLDEATAAARELGMLGVLRRIDEVTLAPENVFRREGDTWRISFDGREVRLRDVKGLADIDALIRAGGGEVPASRLAGMHLPGDAGLGADPVLDRRAQQEYRAQLAQLGEELEEADRAHDLDRVTAIGDERAFLVRELSSAVGLGQRDRGLGDDRERARKAVTARIRDAVGRIGAVHPTLGDHLSRAVHTGNSCSYRPADPVRWTS
jgi:tetratricopeptide (TPR) repeat protein